MDGKNDHKDKQRDHQVLGNALQAALEIEAQHQEAEDDSDQHIDNVDARIGDHTHEAEISVLADQELNKIIDHPAGDDGIERHQGDVAKQGKVAVDVPLLAFLFQLVIHPDRACLGGTAHREFHDHRGQAEQKQAQNIHQHKAAAAELTGHPREFPYVAAADRTSGTQQNEAKAAAESFTFVVHTSLSFLLFSAQRRFPVSRPGRECAANRFICSSSA